MKAKITSIDPNVDNGEEYYEVRFKVRMTKCDYTILTSQSHMQEVEVSFLQP